MRGRNRTGAACLMVIAAIGVVSVTACGASADNPGSTTTSPSVQPTSKATLPGPNEFSPAPLAPLNPTVGPSAATTAHP